MILVIIQALMARPDNRRPLKGLPTSETAQSGESFGGVLGYVSPVDAGPFRIPYKKGSLPPQLAIPEWGDERRRTHAGLTSMLCVYIYICIYRPRP